MRRRRSCTLASLKDEVRIALRDLARGGLAGEALAERVGALAEKHAPRSEEDLVSVARHTPQLRAETDEQVRANVIAALRRALEQELEEIGRGGPEYLELADKNRGCC